MSTLLFGLALILMGFSLSSFKFISVLLMVENLNVLILFWCYLSASGGHLMAFILFIVVATIEVTLALVALTRLWDYDSLSY